MIYETDTMVDWHSYNLSCACFHFLVVGLFPNEPVSFVNFEIGVNYDFNFNRKKTKFPS